MNTYSTICGHKQVDVNFFNIRTIQVDEEIKDMLELLWSKDYWTYNSCQDNNGMIWIDFDLDSFKTLMQRCLELKENMIEFDMIKFLWADDGHPDSNDEYWITGKNMLFSVSLRFPISEKQDFMNLFEKL